MKKFWEKYGKIGLILLILLLVIGIVVFFGIKKDEFKNVSDDSSKVEDKEVKKDEDNEEITPILYEVSKEGSNNKLYLFGSIHVADDRAYPLPDKVMKAYEESDALAVEVDVVGLTKNLNLQVDTLKVMLIPDGTTVKNCLEEETYQMMVDYLKKNKMYYSSYEYYKPALHYSLISSLQAEKTGLKATKGIDLYFLEEAYKDEKEILEIESAISQYQMLASLPDELFDFFIQNSIKHEDEMIRGTNELYENWLKGDSEELLETLNEENSDYEEYNNVEYFDSLAGMLEEYNTKMIDERNELMLNKAKEYYGSGKDVFYVVGLAHIIGDEGLAESLKNEGYTINLVSYN